MEFSNLHGVQVEKSFLKALNSLKTNKNMKS